MISQLRVPVHRAIRSPFVPSPEAEFAFGPLAHELAQAVQAGGHRPCNQRQLNRVLNRLLFRMVVNQNQ